MGIRTLLSKMIERARFFRNHTDPSLGLDTDHRRKFNAGEVGKIVESLPAHERNLLRELKASDIQQPVPPKIVTPTIYYGQETANRQRTPFSPTVSNQRKQPSRRSSTDGRRRYGGGSDGGGGFDD